MKGHRGKGAGKQQGKYDAPNDDGWQPQQQQQIVPHQPHYAPQNQTLDPTSNNAAYELLFESFERMAKQHGRVMGRCAHLWASDDDLDYLANSFYQGLFEGRSQMLRDNR